MWITPANRVGCLPLEPLRGDATLYFTNLPRQNDGCNGGTNKPNARNYGRRLIYRGVNFVIGSLGEVGLRNRRDAYHGA